MKYNLPEQLHKIKTKNLSVEDKNLIWSGIIFNKPNKVKGILLPFNLHKNMIGVLIALAVVLGGGGVVAASNTAVPGDSLFGVDLAVEKAKIALASSEDKKNELKIKFAEERLSEVETIVNTRGSVIVADTDLSSSSTVEVEIDVFTNETTVKIEAGDKKYGFVTTEKDKDLIIAEIKTKYKLTDAQINSNLSFETEDRDSRVDDKKFLNSWNSISFKSEKQQKEFEGSLNDVAEMVASSNLSAEQKEKLSQTLAGIMTLLATDPNLKMEIKNKDGFKVEVENGKIEIKSNNGNSGSSDDNNSKHDNSDDLDDDIDDDSGTEKDDSDDESDDESGDDGDDDSSGDSDEGDDDSDENDDDDNSGHGGGNDDDDDSEDDN